MKLNIRQSHTFNLLYPPAPLLGPKVAELRAWWEAEGQTAIDAISQRIGLTFAEQELPAYIHDGPPGGSSDPVNVSVNSKLPLEHVLIHELIHHLLSFNEQGYTYKPFYPEEEPLVDIHVIVHAIHEWYCVTHGKADLIAQDKKHSQKHPAYARSWEIVREEGFVQIVNRLQEAAR